MSKEGKKIFELIKKLFPINRSLTGEGNRKTLNIIKENLKNLQILEFKSGKKVFDWIIPPEWNVEKAYISDSTNKKIVDFKKNNLHLVGYSQPFKGFMSLEKLKNKLHTIPKQPNAIPYLTSYYKKNWGFCITENQKKKLKKGKYKVVVETKFNKKGSLSVGELFIKGRSNKEITLSTNICHPSMANNELSGPGVLTSIGKYLLKNKNYYSYRLIFTPETVGVLSYLSNRLSKIKKNFHAGFHLTCIGDGGPYSMISTSNENSYSDKIAKLILKFKNNKKIYSFLERGSDERQFNSPNINLPVVTLMRTKFLEFKEYHTSLDNLKILNPKSLQDSYNFVKEIIDLIENDYKIFSLVKGEPFYSKNLFRNIGSKQALNKVEWDLFNLPAYANGERLHALSNKLDRSPRDLLKTLKILTDNKIIKILR